MYPPVENDCGTMRLILRITARVLCERKTNSPSVGYFFEHRCTFDELLSHADKKEEYVMKQNQERVDTLARLLSEHGNDVSNDLIMDVVLKTQINGHRVIESESFIHFPVGYAVFLGASKSDQTCEANDDFFVVFKKNRITFRAMRDFSVSSSLELRNSYISSSHSHRCVRRNSIQKKPKILSNMISLLFPPLKRHCR